VAERPNRLTESRLNQTTKQLCISVRSSSQLIAATIAAIFAATTQILANLQPDIPYLLTIIIYVIKSSANPLCSALAVAITATVAATAELSGCCYAAVMNINMYDMS